MAHEDKQGMHPLENWHQLKEGRSEVMKLPKACPQCGGALSPKIFGKLHDKYLICPYCRFQVDIPDEFEVKKAEETRGPDGSRRRVEVSYRRKDLTPEKARSLMGSRATMQESGGEKKHLGGKTLRREKTLPDGTHIVEVERTHDFEVNGKADLKNLESILGKHFDLSELQNLSAEFKLVPGIPEMEKEFTKSYTWEKIGPAQSGDDESFVIYRGDSSEMLKGFIRLVTLFFCLLGVMIVLFMLSR